MIAIYAIISTILLAFVAAVWSSKLGMNLLIKLTYVLAALFGAVIVAKLWIIS